MDNKIKVGDLVRVTEDNWCDTIGKESIGIVTEADGPFQVVTVNVTEHGECWFALGDLEILNKSRR